MAVASRSPKRSPAGGPLDRSSKILKMEAGFTSHAAPPDVHSVIAAAASGSSPWASSPRGLNDDEGSSLRRQLSTISQMILGRQPSSLRRLQNLRADKEVDSHTHQLVERVRRGASETAACSNGDSGSNEPLPNDARAALASLLSRYGMSHAADVLMSVAGPGSGSGHYIAPGYGPEGEPIPTLQFSNQRSRRGGWF